MKKITQEDLNEILAAHARWLKDPNTGKRPRFVEADFRGHALTLYVDTGFRGQALTLYIDTRPGEPMDANTAERFVKVELPDMFDADEYLNTLDIFPHPYITYRTNTEAYEVDELMARFVGHWAQSTIGAGEGEQ